MLSALLSAWPRGTVARMDYKRGHRPVLIAALDALAEGWDHFGNSRLSEQSRAAADDLRKGASSTVAGHTVYAVAETVAV